MAKANSQRGAAGLPRIIHRPDLQSRRQRSVFALLADSISVWFSVGRAAFQLSTGLSLALVGDGFAGLARWLGLAVFVVVCLGFYRRVLAAPVAG